MCRFLLLKSNKNINPCEIIQSFSQMAEKSKAPDGDWQGDGFGISWLDSENNWHIYKNTKPIWEIKNLYKKIPDTDSLVIHARSATFKSQIIEGDTAFNQPFINEKYSFVFNGHLKGVNLNSNPVGRTGAEKIWNLYLKKFDKEDTFLDLKNLEKFMSQNVREIIAMNIGIHDKNNIYGMCNYKPNEINPDYHRLNYYKNKGIKIICSERLELFKMRKIGNGEIIRL